MHNGTLDVDANNNHGQRSLFCISEELYQGYLEDLFDAVGIDTQVDGVVVGQSILDLCHDS